MKAKSNITNNLRQSLVVLVMLIIGLGIALLLMVGHHAQAAVPPGPASPMGACEQYQPAMAYNSTSGEYLVIWQDRRDSTQFDIYGQRLSSSGALVGNEFLISAAPARPSFPAVTYDSTTNAFLVVWQDARNSAATGLDIYGQRVLGSGALAGSEIPISTVAQGQEYPKVAFNSTSGEYLAVWRDRRNDTTTGWDIYGQRIAGGGALAGSNFPIAIELAGEQFPTVAYSSAGTEYLVAWEDNREDATNVDISAQRVSSSGALVGSKIPISTQLSSNEYRPAIAASSAALGEYLLVWQNTATDNVYIHGQRVSSSGALVGSNFPIPTASGEQFNPAVAYNGSTTEYLVAWQDRRNGFSNPSIYGQRVSGTGTLVGSEIPISTIPQGQQAPQLAYNSAGSQYMTAWEGYESSTGSSIYGQRVSGTGTLVGSSGCVTGCVPPSTGTPSATPIATATAATATPPPNGCTSDFTDVPPSNTFYAFVRCLACRGIIGGYSDGTFRPNANVTRGQLSKIVANSAGFNEPVTGQTFQDVPASNSFHLYVERMASRGIIGGYNCGGPGEPCGGGNLPYFRPNANATRGQITKIVSNAKGYNDPPGAQLFQDVAPGSTFYDWVNRLASRGIMGGYPCGGAGEPCGGGNLPYFRPNNNATRGQTSKVVAGTFFPGCETR
ncbi:MAG TPA: S-layer homology domain-containing protein [Chloroflexia bacterium]|nr:S-layer homology domain-containing protein [Chloroflexia bacterium]